MRNQSKVWLFLCLMAVSICAQLPTNWIDCTVSLLAGKTQPWPGGISGVRCNRLNGDLYMDCIGFGIWKSTDKGATWSLAGNNTITGRLETGWGMDQDQNNPARMAVFSLDGKAGWTADGVTWKAMTDVGRNWDYGSVDWGSTNPKTIFGCTHEAGGYLDVSTDGGTTWRQLTARINSGSALATISMVGVMDSTTLIYHTDNNGIQRSTDLGNTWAQVSTINPQSRVPVLFKGVHYLCTNQGLLVSKDKGATWQSQGTSVNIFQGPFFGENENTMVVVGNLGIYHSSNAGTQWTKIANICPTLGSDQANYWATYAWDPINNCIYATVMAKHGYRLDLPGSTKATGSILNNKISSLVISGNAIRSPALISKLEIFSLAGKVLFTQKYEPAFTISIPEIPGITQAGSIIRIKTAKGMVSQTWYR